VHFLDAARGSAMLFVLLSHFGFTFFPNQGDRLPTVMRLVGMVASPTFIILSGMMLGFLYRTSPASFGRLRIKLTDRGLFLLTVGHLVLLASHAPLYTIRFFHITDTIGVCLLIQPWLITRLRTRGRLVLSSALFVGSWILVEWWRPAAPVVHLIKETLFGDLTAVNYYRFVFPIVPWFSLDLAATVLGDRLGEHFLRDDLGAMQRLLMRTAAAGALTAAIGKAIRVSLVHVLPGNTLVLITRVMSSPLQKQPPGLIYIVFYGSMGLGLLSGCLFLERTGRLRRPFDLAAMLGRTSLFVFLGHWFVYLIAIMGLRNWLPFVWAWPSYFVMSVVLIVSSAAAWHRRGYNRFITVGYPRVREIVREWQPSHPTQQPSTHSSAA
jgi:peptidoglycan/LPS O-acetylase OafA/YrhL